MKVTVALSVLTALVISIFWISQVHFTAEANAKELIGVTVELREIKALLREQNERLARIEGKLE